MGNDLKYIMIDEIFPVVFGSYLVHKDVADGLAGKYGKVTSAGFVQNNGDHFKAYGRSESLNLDSKPADTRIITKVLSS